MESFEDLAFGGKSEWLLDITPRPRASSICWQLGTTVEARAVAVGVGLWWRLGSDVPETVPGCAQ